MKLKTLREEFIDEGAQKGIIEGRVDVACGIIDMGLLTDEQIASATKQTPEDIVALRRCITRERENMVIALIQSDDLSDEQIASITKQTTARVIALRRCVREERARMLRTLITLGLLTDAEISSFTGYPIDDITDLRNELKAQNSNNSHTKEAQYLEADISGH